ncbi:MAG: penicillin-insensitive murein endopeptidase [bacterium]|nr:penicillin-insensitive murein endopeptidase [bacterium]
MKYSYLLIAFLAVACMQDNSEIQAEESRHTQKELSAAEKYYLKHVNDSLESSSIGSVSNGKLENATLIPFKGENYEYFDVSSYTGGRAFTHNKVVEITLNTYQALLDQGVDRKFKVMEFSRKEGGKIFPHRTHQNGLSVDYMMPLQKEGKPYYEYDKKGASHYLMEFDKEGRYLEDTDVSIDFNMAARHILELDKQARKNGLRIHKVIFNTDLKDELYASEYGKKLKTSGIYITRNLTKVINDLHDDHYHVDFCKL